jgi:glucose-1-phosphatase
MRLCIFDVGGVMVDGFNVAPDIAARLGVTADELRPLLWAADYELLHTGRISSPEFWDRFRATTGLAVDDELWGALFHPVRRPRMYDLVDRLRRGGTRAVAGTNTLDAHYRIHSDLGDYDVFDHTYASNLIHLAKPDPAF